MTHLKVVNFLCIGVLTFIQNLSFSLAGFAEGERHAIRLFFGCVVARFRRCDVGCHDAWAGDGAGRDDSVAVSCV